ncbi:MAG: hypothetical protein QOI83_1734 [Streptomycetaceae bacterium]|nr:hypothetical protein [Streptomycetaceae bacterium]
MSLLVLLVGLATLLGAASYSGSPLFLVAVVVVCGWLIAFSVRERISRTRNR